MHHHRYTIGEFIGKGHYYGMQAGALAGALIYPFLGILPGFSLGMVIGAAFGLIIGIGVAGYNALYLHFDTDLTDYRRSITLKVGVGATLMPPIIIWGCLAAARMFSATSFPG
jgi:hypothetical protein